MGTAWRDALRGAVRGVREELFFYRCLVAHPRTPWAARLLLGAAAGYAVSPIDLIPDFIPVVGYLDDLLVVPLLVWAAMKLVPADVVTECRGRAQGRPPEGRADR